MINGTIEFDRREQNKDQERERCGVRRFCVRGECENEKDLTHCLADKPIVRDGAPCVLGEDLEKDDTKLEEEDGEKRVAKVIRVGEGKSKIRKSDIDEIQVDDNYKGDDNIKKRGGESC